MGTKDFRIIARRFAKINMPDNSDLAFKITHLTEQIISCNKFLLAGANVDNAPPWCKGRIRLS